MYHPQQQGSHPFPNIPRPPASQHPNNLQPVDFQFPCPNQLPDELESVLAIQGMRDMDHRQVDQINQPNQLQNQGLGSGIGQHRDFGSNPVSPPADNQAGLQQGVNWSNYQPPTKLFTSHPPTTGNQGTQLQNQNNQTGASSLNWKPSVGNFPSPQIQQSHGAGSGGEGQTLYTPESAGSILASFGLSNEDLEVLSHYPDDQLTPDTLPFILRDIQINKSGLQKPMASTSLTFSHNIHDTAVLSSRALEVPGILAVTQTAGKIIDYGHSSQAKDDSKTKETFKREPLSSDRTVKMYQATSSAAVPKVEKTKQKQVIEYKEPSQNDVDYRRTNREKHRDEDYRRTSREKHGDEDYRRTSREKHGDEDYRRTSREKHGDEDYRRTSREKHGDEDYRRMSREKRRSSHSPGKEFAPLPKSHHLDRDYRHMESKLRSEGFSKLSLSSSELRPHGSSRKLPTPTMISDFAAVSPKVYPHTCSLCNVKTDQEKDWVEHVNTVDHTAACRDLRNKYPGWKPNLPSRSGRYGSRALWDPKDGSPFDSVSRSLSHSPSPPPCSHQEDTYPLRPHRRPYSPHRHPGAHHYPVRSHRFNHRHSRSPPYSHGTSLHPREDHPERRSRESSGGFSRSSVKRLRDGSVDTSRSPPSSAADHSSKHKPLRPSSKTVKGAPKPGTKTTKSVKPTPAKKKKVVAPASQDRSAAKRVVYLTGIPKDATEQEITDLVVFFGKMKTLTLVPCSEEESEKGQKASVYMLRAEDAQAFASAPNLFIREKEITASLTKKPDKQFSDSKSKPGADTHRGASDAAVSSSGMVQERRPDPNRMTHKHHSAGGDADRKTSDQNGKVLITGLPESGWSETDIIQLVQPFGIPSDIILSTNIRKALVSLEDLEVSQEMVKVHSFKPAVVNGTEVKMSLLKQHIGLSTPVALYNLFMGSVDPLENVAPVAWNRLLVVKNVPETPSSSSEVIKLMQRFGKVKKTLVLNSMVICEMVTAAVALSVYKRFQKFPCIVQNNPLFFSRKPDHKASTHAKVIAAFCDSPEVKPVSSKDSQAAAAAPKKEAASCPEISEAPVENCCDKNSFEKSTEDESLKQTDSKGDKKDEFGISESSAVLDTKPHSDSLTESKETLAGESETTEVSKEMEKLEKMEKIKSASCEGITLETNLPELPKITQAMVDTLLEECRIRTASHSKTAASPLGGEQEEAQEQPEQEGKAAGLSKNSTEGKEVVKTQEREKKDSEVRNGKERRERERVNRERERAEKARREQERRKEERRERERRDRRREYVEHQSGSRSSYRSERYRQSFWRDEHSSVETENRMEDEEEFPFNMNDFVTVDEVGDVTDLPCPLSSAVHVETSQEQSDSPKHGQQDFPENTHSVESTVTQEQSDEKISEAEHVGILTFEEPDSKLKQDLSTIESPLLASQVHSLSSETPSQEAEASGCDTNPETDTLPAASLDLTLNVEPLLTPVRVTSADSGSDCLAVRVVTTKSEEEKESRSVSHSPTQNDGMEGSDSQEQDGLHAEKKSVPVRHSLTKNDWIEALDSQEHEVQDAEKESGPVSHGLAENERMEASDSKDQDEQDAAKERGLVGHSLTQNDGMEASDSQEQEVHTEEKLGATGTKAAAGKPEKIKDSINTDQLLPPYDPRTSFGMEYLVPKTGFFCKACSRFFSGTKVAEISHCKTLKHYENLKKMLETIEPESERTPTD